MFWIAVLYLFSSWDDKIVCDKLVVYDVWFAADDNSAFFSVGVDIFESVYICKNDQYPCQWCQLVL